MPFASAMVIITTPRMLPHTTTGDAERSVSKLRDVRAKIIDFRQSKGLRSTVRSQRKALISIRLRMQECTNI